MDIEHYRKAAQLAQQLADDNTKFLESIRQQENNMTIFDSIRERLGNSQTTLSGVLSMALPFVLGALGVAQPQILLANAGLAVLTAWLAKKDATSAAGLTGSFGAMALQSFGIPVPEFVIAGLNGFVGFFSRDQKPS